jgi:Protein of unknown function (DUF3043)
MTDSQTPKPEGKGRPTPTRKEREAANIRPIVGQKTPEARKADKSRLNEERAKARAGLLAGEERYLGPRDKGPQKRMARDIVDARLFTVGEILIPAMLIIILTTNISNSVIITAGIVVLYAILVAVVIDSTLIMRKVKSEIERKYGSVDRGVRWYAASRGFQMRPMRLPKPQVKRGSAKK